MAQTRLFAAATALILAVALGACSEKQYGLLVCPSGPVDTLVIAPRLEFLQLEVIGDTTTAADHDPGMAGMESLYLGADGGTRSEILLNYDFSDVLGDSIPASALDPGQIRSVRLRFILLRRYCSSYDTQYPWGDMRAAVRALPAPFDPQAYVTDPGPEADPGAPVGLDQTLDGCLPSLDLFADVVGGWIRNQERVGLGVETVAGSDAGLVAFASREFATYRELPEYPMTMRHVGPTILVSFVDPAIPVLAVPPRNDTSTFSGIAAPPPGMLNVRTGLRSYPVLTYDVPALSANRCVRSYSWRVFDSTLDSIPPEGFTVSLLDTTAVDLAGGRIRDAELAQALRSWNTLWVWPPPGVIKVIMFIRDPVLGGYSTPAHIYFSQNFFYGPAGPPAYRPFLRLVVGARDE